MASLVLHQDTERDQESIKHIDTLIEEAKCYILSDHARLQDFAQRIHSQSEEVGYYYGIAYAEYYKGRSSFMQAAYEQALAHSQTALLLFEQGHEVHAVAQCLRQMGGVYQVWGQYDTALQHYRREEEIYKSPQHYDEEGVVGVVMEIATVYMMISQYDIALTYYQQALRYVTGRGNDVRLAKVLANVATLYILMNEYATAADYQERALALYRKMNNKEAMAQILLNMGWRCLRQNKHEGVIEYGNLALAVCEELGNRRLKAMALLNTASAYLSLQKSDEAQELLRESATLAAEVGDKRTCGAVQHTLGSFFLEQKEYEKSRVALNRALEFVRELGLKHEEYELYQLLARVEEGEGNAVKALNYYREYIRVKEEVLDEKRSQAISEMQMRFNVEQSEKEKEIYRLKNVELAEILAKVETLNAHLAEMNEEKDSVLKIVAHDLKNPLTALGLTVSMARIRLEEMSQEEVREQLHIVDKTVDRLNSIVSRLSDMSMIESGQMTLSPTRLDLNESVQSCMAMYRERIKEKGIGLQHDMVSGGVWLYVDRNSLDEVIDNLLSNAVKYSLAGKVIQVHTWINGDTGGLSITDGGLGIKEEDRKKLFKKFSRLHTRPTGGEGSTGLGLWIVKKLVEKMDGDVTCESQPGAGATFTVSFSLPKPHVAGTVGAM